MGEIHEEREEMRQNMKGFKNERAEKRGRTRGRGMKVATQRKQMQVEGKG